jgi:hypothetical protein
MQITTARAKKKGFFRSNSAPKAGFFIRKYQRRKTKSRGRVKSYMAYLIETTVLG